ncbi:MAG: ATP synthase F1 subunit delta [Pirellulales bacterium]|nr:ATP synthase F1 subunit delta [Planctomycetales bacterium]MCA9184834.1 ATP synthase F1 subunit delta [Planctomycetales bacterium]
MSDGQSDYEHASTTAADAAAQHVGIVYAKSLLGAAEKIGVIKDVLAELNSFVRDVLDHFPEFEATLTSGLLSASEKAEMFERVMAGRTSDLFGDFLKVLAQHDRLGYLRVIRTEARRLHDEMRGIVRVSVRTAVPLSEPQQVSIANRLRSIVAGEPALDLHIDPTIIGGIVFQVGDTVYDGSVARQLRNVREQMIDRSIHEIQSRRDSFSYSA